MENYIKSKIREHSDTLQIRQEKFDTWLKGIITIATGLIALLISLKTSTSKSHTQHVLYGSTIGLLSLGILFGTIRLFQSVSLLDQEAKVHQEHLQQQLRGKSGDIVGFVKPKIVYVIASYISVISFVLALAALVLYAWLIDSNIK
jgi:hypothetical protein